jgi:hypothetical protein
MKLLSRVEFKTAVFKRDKDQCLICRQPAVDAHHIVERKLFKDGGYYLDNGASVCEMHHFQAEQTVISCQQLRNLAKIKSIGLPNNFDSALNYDKWGNIILPNNRRLPGPMFHLDSVQKVLASANLLSFFNLSSLHESNP